MAFASTTVTPTDGGTGAGAGTGTGDSGGASGGAGSGSGAPSSNVSGQPSTPATLDWKTAPAQFREGYDAIKKQYDDLQKQFEPWKGLNVQPQQVTQYQQSYQQVYTEVKGIADSIGIDEREVAAAIQQHGLLPVLDQLRYEAQQADAANNGDADVIRQQELDQRIQAEIDQRLSPVMQRENARLVHEGNALVERTINQLATDSFKAAGIDYAGAPKELKMFIETGVTEALKYDEDGIRALKFEGKTAAIQRAFQTFQSMWDAAYLARRSMEGKIQPQQQRGGQQQQQATGKRPSIEEMIDNPNSIREAQGKPAYAT